MYSGIVVMLTIFVYLHLVRNTSTREALPLAAAISVLLVAQFLLYLFSFYPEEPPLAFGVPPFYTAGGPLDTIGQFVNFFGFVLPTRMGIVYAVGIAAMVVPNAVTRDDRLASYYRLFTLVTFLSIFVVHSSFYSNDYGWRTVSASQMLLACFAAVAVDRLASKRWT